MLTAILKKEKMKQYKEISKTIITTLAMLLVGFLAYYWLLNFDPYGMLFAVIIIFGIVFSVVNKNKK